MRNILCFFLFFSGAFNALALQNDSSAYQAQRLKINALLAERSARFGQYDESLTARSGIFGLQTKKDIRNSNEILRQVVLNDNNIFKELKILMDYKDLEVKQVKNNVSESSDRILHYKTAIKTLQDQNEQLRKETMSQNVDKNLLKLTLALAVFTIAALLWFFTKKINRLTKRNEEAVF